MVLRGLNAKIGDDAAQGIVWVWVVLEIILERFMILSQGL